MLNVVGWIHIVQDDRVVGICEQGKGISGFQKKGREFLHQLSDC